MNRSPARSVLEVSEPAMPEGGPVVTTSTFRAVDGMPLYTFAGDSDAGDVTGQGVQDVWWAVAPDGAKVTRAAASEPAPVPGY